MRRQWVCRAVPFSVVVVLVVGSAQGAQSSEGRRGGLYGDWQIKMTFGERQMDSILAFSRDAEGNRTAQWISFMGLTEAKDLKFEDGKLSFTTERPGPDGQSFTSTLTATIEEGKLSGTLSTGRGEFKIEGQRAPRMPRAVGDWQMTYKVGEREMTGTLSVRVDKEGKLTGKWKSQRGESDVTDLQYERGKVSFKRQVNMQDGSFEIAFAGTVQSDALTGTFTSDRGEIPAEGKLQGASLIGTWNLETTSERGTRRQRLVVHPDMTGLLDAIPIKQVNLEDAKVTFAIVLEFGEQKFEMNFEGKIEESKLTGELKTSRGSSKIKGAKVVRTFRRPTSQ